MSYEKNYYNIKISRTESQTNLYNGPLNWHNTEMWKFMYTKETKVQQRKYYSDGG